MTPQADRESIAARWLIEQDGPAFSDEQRDALARWLVESVENCRTYLRLVRAWRRTVLLRRNETPLVYGIRRSASAGNADAGRRASESRTPPRRERVVGARGHQPTTSRVRAVVSRMASVSSSRKDQLSRRFGKVLRDCRFAQGWSLSELAAKSRVDRTYISQVEAGVHSPTLTVLCRLAHALRVPASQLIARVERGMS